MDGSLAPEKNSINSSRNCVSVGERVINVVVGIFHPVLALIVLLCLVVKSSFNYASLLTPKKALLYQFLGLATPIALWAFILSPLEHPGQGWNIVVVIFSTWCGLFLLHSFLTMLFRYGDIISPQEDRIFAGLPSLQLVVGSAGSIQNFNPSKRLKLMGETILSYLMIILCFSVIYDCLYTVHPFYFHVPEDLCKNSASYSDFIYFSFVTTATVGYGDFYPLSTSIRWLTVSQIVFTLTYFPLIVTGFLESLRVVKNKDSSNEK